MLMSMILFFVLETAAIGPAEFKLFKCLESSNFILANAYKPLLHPMIQMTKSSSLILFWCIYMTLNLEKNYFVDFPNSDII